MADKGIVATEQMLAVVQQAGKLEQWLTSFADAMTKTGFIAASRKA